MNITTIYKPTLNKCQTVWLDLAAVLSFIAIT